MIQLGDRKIKNSARFNYGGNYLLALNRDGMVCVDCGSQKFLVVHHLDESRKTGNINNNLDNLITLCKKCHAERHGLCFSIPGEIDKLIKKYRDNGYTFRQIGECFELSRQRVHQLYSRMTKKKNTP